MIRKTLWRTLTMLTILSMTMPFVYATPSTQPPPPEQAETMTNVENEQTVIPRWAEVKETTAPTAPAAPAAIEAYEYEYEWIGTSAIPDGSCGGGTGTSITLNVPDSFTIVNLAVGFNADHTWRSDVHARLTSPANTPVVLLDGSSGFDFDNFDVLFADGGNPVSAIDHDHTLPPFYGEDTWAPIDPLSGLLSENAQGDWTLYVCDDGFGDTGSVHRWALFFNEIVVTPPNYAGSTKSANPTSIAPSGETLTYTIVISNSSGIVAHDVHYF